MKNMEIMISFIDEKGKPDMKIFQAVSLKDLQTLPFYLECIEKQNLEGVCIRKTNQREANIRDQLEFMSAGRMTLKEKPESPTKHSS